MKIYDCFMFFDEEMLLDLRLNIMDKYVDKFVITEATYMHSGRHKKLQFNIDNYKKFKDKIIYIKIENEPEDLYKINKHDTEEKKNSKKIDNAKKREMYQINKANEGLINADANDIIIISDLDEIPNLKEVNFKKVKEKFIFFKQKMYYYKFNLLYKSLVWYGSKACKKKYLHSPEELRSSKNKKYPLWRLDVLFSKLKHNNIYVVENGGWHFSNIKKPEELEKKMQNFLHHIDYESSGLNAKDLEKLIKEKRVMYNHALDKKENKWGKGKKLEPSEIKEMPKYIAENLMLYQEWLDLDRK
jgi:beta-1,4-mannosyl-glycoprotein beta-1,4-N-acetylglucosaminyltransferase